MPLIPAVALVFTAAFNICWGGWGAWGDRGGERDHSIGDGGTDKGVLGVGGMGKGVIPVKGMTVGRIAVEDIIWGTNGAVVKEYGEKRALPGIS